MAYSLTYDSYYDDMDVRFDVLELEFQLRSARSNQKEKQEPPDKDLSE